MRVTCTRCLGPVPVVGDRVARHMEQVFGGNGWVDGYVRCGASGQRLNGQQQRELVTAPDTAAEVLVPVVMDSRLADLADLIEELPLVLRTARKAEGYTLRELAPVIGLHHKTLNRIELGESTYSATLVPVLRWLDSLGHGAVA